MLRASFAAIAVALTALWLFFWRAPLSVQWSLAPNDSAWPVGAWLLPLGVALIFGGAAALSVYDRFKRAKTRREQTNSTVTALICLAILGILWPWALLGPGALQTEPGKATLEGRFNVIAAMWSDVATEYFGAAYQIQNPREFARTYARIQHPAVRAQAHIATHPPGATLWFYGARRFYESVPGIQSSFSALAQTVTRENEADLLAAAQLARASAASVAQTPVPLPLPASAVGGALFCAVLLGLSLVAALPAVYGLAALGGGENAEARGLIAAALWVLAPTTNLFAFTLDALVASGAAWTLFFAALAWTRSNSKSADSSGTVFKRAALWWIASGATLAFTTFISIGALAVGVIIALALLIFRPRGAGRAALFLGAAFGAVWALLALWGGFNPLQIVGNAMAAHRFATLEVRTYWPWVALNLGVWMLFIGWPTVALLAKGVTLYKENAPVASGICLGLATLITLLLLSLSGNVRGEVERLWLFALAPLCVTAAAGARENWRVWAVLLSLQALQTLLMAATLAPLVRPF